MLINQVIKYMQAGTKFEDFFFFFFLHHLYQRL